MNIYATYLPMDRRLALATGKALTERTEGVALLADISGFTVLTRTLVEELGPQRGAEEILRQINPVYEALITELHRYRGSVMGFAGDSITCWLDEDKGYRGVACALAMQRVMGEMSTVVTPGGTTIRLYVKVALAVGSARRFVVGDEGQQLIDVLAGQTLDWMAGAEGVAERGDVVVDASILDSLGGDIEVGEVRESEGGRRVGVVTGLVVDEALVGVGWDNRDDVIDVEVLEPWILEPVSARLRAGQEFLAELRPVVVLFLKFSGLDYDGDEGAGDKLSRYIKWVQKILAEHEAYLLQITIGDKGSYLYAAFGALIAHYDDATRAVSAGMALSRMPKELAYIQDVKIGISQGIMWTGAVGAEVRHTYAVMGDETNMAARLMGKAEVGQVLVRQRVADAANQQYLFRSLGEMMVKGSGEPIAVAELLGWQRGGEMWSLFERPLVGRNQELAQLGVWLEEVGRGKGQVVRVEGGMGLGKSHLMATFSRHLVEQGGQVLVGLCQSMTRGIAYAPWRRIFRQLLDVEDGIDEGTRPDSYQATLRHLRHVLARINRNWVVRLPLLGDLLGIPIADNPTTDALEASLRQKALFALAVDLLRYYARQSSLILLLDDIHWADEVSLALALAVGRAIGRDKIMLVVSHRPPIHADQPILPDLTQLEHGHTLIVEPLGRDGIQELVANQLGGKPSPLLVSLINEKAQGGPFFAVELIDTLLEGGDLWQEGGEWYIGKALFDTLKAANFLVKDDEGEWDLIPDAALATINLGIPDTVYATVLTRIDRLPERCKPTIKLASVVGRTFASYLVAKSHPGGITGQELSLQLQEMSKRDLVHAGAPMVEGMNENKMYLFRHNAVQEVAYDTLLFAQRRQLHLAVMEALIALYPDEVAQIAYHGFVAEAWSEALHYQMRAGQQAQHLAANQEAAEHYRKCLICLDSLVEGDYQRERLAVHLSLGELLVSLGQYDEAKHHLEEGLVVGEVMGELGAQARAYRWLARWHELQGQYQEARASIQKGLAVLTEETAEAAELLITAGLIDLRQGVYEQASALGAHGLRIAEQVGDTAVLGRAHGFLGQVERLQGDRKSSIKRFERSLRYYEEANNIHGQALAQNLLATAYFDMSQLQESDRYYRLARETFARIGDVYNQALVENNLGGIGLKQGRLDEAQSFFEQSLWALVQLGASLWAVGALHMNVGHALVLQGDLEAGLAHLETSVTYYEQVGSRDFLPEVFGIYAQAEMKRGNVEEARNWGKKALGMAKELAMPSEEGNAYRILGEVALQANDWGEAEKQLVASEAVLAEVGGSYYEGARTKLAQAKLYVALREWERAAEALAASEAVLVPLDTRLEMAEIQRLRQMLAES
ncbi:MAG TPA: tetratricopeptide repeat protein [Anaerolineae bacterium]|nr:tetratricopeptide repeat protein [Anaerolineae bacterium]